VRFITILKLQRIQIMNNDHMYKHTDIQTNLQVLFRFA
jgi:hypothetical protein